MSKFSDTVKINKYKLPDECEQHAGLYHNILDERVEIQTELDAMKDSLKLYIAELGIDIRAKWSDSDGKITEGAVSSRVDASPKVVSRKENIREKEKELALLDAAKSAMEHRKSMLNNLTSLLIGGFYSAPEGGRKDTPNYEAEKAVRRGLNKKRMEEEEDEF